MTVAALIRRGRAAAPHREVADEGVAWIEEPTRADDLADHARIAAAARTPIQLGQARAATLRSWSGAPCQFSARRPLRRAAIR
jgi:hypothetical protein